MLKYSGCDGMCFIIYALCMYFRSCLTYSVKTINNYNGYIQEKKKHNQRKIMKYQLIFNNAKKYMICILTLISPKTDRNNEITNGNCVM